MLFKADSSLILVVLFQNNDILELTSAGSALLMCYTVLSDHQLLIPKLRHNGENFLFLISRSGCLYLESLNKNSSALLKNKVRKGLLDVAGHLSFEEKLCLCSLFTKKSC